MADIRFFTRRGPFTLAELAAALGGTVAPASHPDFAVRDIAPIEACGPDTLVFAQGRHIKSLSACGAGAAIVRAVPDIADGPANYLLSDNPEIAFVKAAGLFYPDAAPAGGIDAMAFVDPTARLEPGVEVAAHASIGPGAEIGAGSWIGPGAIIGRGVTVGRGCRIGPRAVVMHAHLGNAVVLHAGCVLGEDGFGYVPGAAGHIKVPQLGRVIVQDHVEIGANSTIDRGRLGDTVIGEGTKIDNLVHIAHNCSIGRHCIIAAQVGFAGSVTVEDFVVLLGQVGVADHLRLGAHAVALAKAGISRSIAAGSVVGGYPARPVKQWHREVGTLARLAKNRGKTEPNPG